MPVSWKPACDFISLSPAFPPAPKFVDLGANSGTRSEIPRRPL
jgi:hypothetical protein